MRLEGIDLLRGIAVVAVIFYHFFAILDPVNNSIFPYVHSFGLFGVSLFFIISGFLIYRSVDYSVSQQGVKRGLLQYANHRLFRILPAYYFNFFIVLLIATFIIESDYFYSLGFLKTILSHLTFTSYFIYKDSGLGINGAYWTLSIEMLWYIIAPFLYIFIKKDKYLVLLFLLSFMYLIGIDISLFDSIFNLDVNASNYTLLLYYLSFQLPGQFIYFLTGIFIYKFLNNPLILSATSRYVLSFLLITVFIFVTSHYNLHTKFALNNLFILFIVSILFILLYRSKPMKMAFIEWIGKISYSLYLWHMVLLYIMKKTAILNFLSIGMTSALFVIMLIMISACSYYFIEEGGFRLRKKIESKFIIRKGI